MFCNSVALHASPQLQSLIACTVRVRLRRPNKSGGTSHGHGTNPVRTHALRCTAAAHRSAAPVWQLGVCMQLAHTTHQSAASGARAFDFPMARAATPCRRAVRVRVRVRVTRHWWIDLHVPRFLGKATPLPASRLRTHAFPIPWGEKTRATSSHICMCACSQVYY